MYDAASQSDIITHQRAVGELRVAVRVRDGITALENLRQAGCMKARFPRPLCPGWLDVATLNTSGGVAGGDRLETTLALRDGARASFSAQAAERFYRALPGSAPAFVRTEISVEKGGFAEWLPQETILFDGCALDRRLDVDLAADARFLGMETLVFGRGAMGERVHQAMITDHVRIQQDNRPLLHDAVRLHGAVAQILARPAVANGASVVATLYYVAPDVAAHLDAVRAALVNPDIEAGASVWQGMLVVRMLGAESLQIRQKAMDILAILRPGRAVPRTWLC